VISPETDQVKLDELKLHSFLKGEVQDWNILAHSVSQLLLRQGCPRSIFLHGAIYTELSRAPRIISSVLDLIARNHSWAGVNLHYKALPISYSLLRQPRVASRSFPRLRRIISAQDENVTRWDIFCIGGAPNNLWFQWTLALFCLNKSLGMEEVEQEGDHDVLRQNSN